MLGETQLVVVSQGQKNFIFRKTTILMKAAYKYSHSLVVDTLF